MENEEILLQVDGLRKYFGGLPAIDGLSFIEHDMDVVFGIAKRIIVLHQGQIIADGEPEDITRNRLVQKVYFGEAA